LKVCVPTNFCTQRHCDTCLTFNREWGGPIKDTPTSPSTMSALFAYCNQILSPLHFPELLPIP
jgi:hypothetical protein